MMLQTAEANERAAQQKATQQSDGASKAVTHHEVAAQQEATRQPTG
jgi:hypothetical protein